MKQTTPLFLFWMLLFLIARANETPGDKKRMHQLSEERKQLFREVKKLEKLDQFQKSSLRKIQNQSFHTIIQSDWSTKSFPEKNPPKVRIREIKVQNEKPGKTDTNIVKSDIRKLYEQKKLLQMQIEENNYLVQAENEKLIQTKISKALLKNKSAREIIKADKQLYYLKEEWARKQKEVFSKIKLGSYNNQVAEAQLMQKQLLSKMSQSGFQMPPGYQTRSSVRKNMPMNNRGLDTKKQDELRTKMNEDIQNLGKLKDSLDHLKLKDSLWFKPNPYKSMAMRDRIKFQFSWQAQSGNNFYPGRIDWMPGFQYLWTPKLQPQMAFVYRMGLGDLQHIAISYQGFGLQGGIQYKLHKSLLSFLSYDHSYFLPTNSSNESKDKYELKPGLIIGLGLKGKIQLMVGYDFLQKYHPEKGSPWIMRFNL